MASVYTGVDARNLTRRKKKEYASTVSKALRQHPDRMRQLGVGEVFRSIMDGQAVLVFSKRTKNLVAFSHLVPSKNEFDEFVDGRVEVGALITLAEEGRGHAKKAIGEAVLLARRSEIKEVRSLVHIENEAANAVMRKVAGEPDHRRPSNYVMEADGIPAQMNVYIFGEIDRKKL